MRPLQQQDSLSPRDSPFNGVAQYSMTTPLQQTRAVQFAGDDSPESERVGGPATAHSAAAKPSSLANGLRKIGAPITGLVGGVRTVGSAVANRSMALLGLRRRAEADVGDNDLMAQLSPPYPNSPFTAPGNGGTSGGGGMMHNGGGAPGFGFPSGLRQQQQNQHSPMFLHHSAAGSAVHSGGSPVLKRFKRHPGSTKQMQPAAAPKVVQDQLRCLPLMRCFAPCIRPPGRRRTRPANARLRRANTQIGDMHASLEAKGSITGAAVGTAAAAAAAMSAGVTGASLKPVYIQVHGARRLVWPMMEGASSHIYYCTLTPGGASPTGGRGVGAESRQAVTQEVELNNGSTNPQWNEVFTFPKTELLSAGGVMLMQVWGRDNYGDDFLIGQGELQLAALLDAPHPTPLAVMLQLMQGDEADDDDTVCGELAVAAWMEREPVVQQQQQQQAMSRKAVGEVPSAAGMAGIPSSAGTNRLAGGAMAASPVLLLPDAAGFPQQGQGVLPAAPPAQPSGALSTGGAAGIGSTAGGGGALVPASSGGAMLPGGYGFGGMTGGGDQGVVMSSLNPPCGTKALPLVVHSPAGTLYEEPCLMYLRVQVSALRDISSDLLMSAVTNTTSRRVKLRPGASACPWSGRTRAFSSRTSLPGSTNTNMYGSTVQGGLRGAAMSMMRLPGVAARKLLGSVSSAAAGRRGPAGGLRGGGGSARGRSGGGSAQRKQDVAGGDDDVDEEEDTAAAGQQGGGGVAGSAAGSGAIGDMMMTEDGNTSLSRSGAGGGMHMNAAVAAAGAAGLLTLEEDDAASSLMQHSSAPGGSGTGDDTTSAAGTNSVAGTKACGGPGMYFYFKVVLDKESQKGRMRWMPQACAAHMSLSAMAFTFAVARPLTSQQLTLQLYLTPSPRKRGTVVARLTMPLLELLDPLLRNDVVPVVDGKPFSSILPFEDPDLGALELTLQLADVDKRSEVYHVPLAHGLLGNPDLHSDITGEPTHTTHSGGYGPHMTLRATGGSDDGADSARELLGGGDGTGTATGGSGSSHNGRGPATGSNKMQGPFDSATSGRQRQRRWMDTKGQDDQDTALRSGALVPVLADQGLLTRVLANTEVDKETQALFMRQLAVAGGGGASGGGGALQTSSSEDIGTGGGGGGGLQKQQRVRQRALTCPIAAMAGSKGSHARKSASGVEPLGTVTIRVMSVNASAGTTSSGNTSSAPSTIAGPSFLVLKVGPHWMRTLDYSASGGNAGASNTMGGAGVGPSGFGISSGGAANGGGGNDGGGPPEWQVTVPLYDPATILSVGVFTMPARSVMGISWVADGAALVAKARLKLSTLNPEPFHKGWYTVALITEAAANQAGITAYGLGSTGVAGASPTLCALAAPGSPSVVARLAVKVTYVKPWRLAQSYISAALPDSYYEMELASAEERRLTQDCNKLVAGWLARAQPPIPPAVTSAMLDEGRHAFDFGRSKANYARLKEGLSGLARLGAWFKHICSWQDVQASCEVAFCIFLTCYFPSLAFQLYFIMLALLGFKRYLALHCPYTRRARAAAAANAASPSNTVSMALVPAQQQQQQLGGGMQGAAGQLLQQQHSPQQQQQQAALQRQQVCRQLSALNLAPGPVHGQNQQQQQQPVAYSASRAAANTIANLMSSGAFSSVGGASGAYQDSQQQQGQGQGQQLPGAGGTGGLGRVSGAGGSGGGGGDTAGRSASCPGAQDAYGTIVLVSRSGASAQSQNADDEDLEVPASSTVAELRRKYESLLDTALAMQNLCDDLAALAERVAAVLSWRDPAATALFCMACLALSVAVWLLGFKTVMFVGLIYQVRPPALRDPLPPPPVNYFLRLPCLSDTA